MDRRSHTGERRDMTRTLQRGRNAPVQHELARSVKHVGGCACVSMASQWAPGEPLVIVSVGCLNCVPLKLGCVGRLAYKNMHQYNTRTALVRGPIAATRRLFAGA
jgi:hypothetical protein